MNIGELKQYIIDNDLPDEMPIGPLDLSTDDQDDGNYPVTIETLLVEGSVDEHGDDGPNMLFITFDNKLNPNPLT